MFHMTIRSMDVGNITRPTNSAVHCEKNIVRSLILHLPHILACFSQWSHTTKPVSPGMRHRKQLTIALFVQRRSTPYVVCFRQQLALTSAFMVPAKHMRCSFFACVHRR